jgi:hypothetical protein
VINKDPIVVPFGLFITYSFKGEEGGGEVNFNQVKSFRVYQFGDQGQRASET